MVDWKIRAIALALTVTLLGLSVAADDDDDERSPGTNQGGYYFPPGGQQYYPQPPRRSPFIYPPYRPTYRPTPAPRRSSFDMSQFVIIYILLQTLSKTTTTAAATTTTMQSTTAPPVVTVCVGSYSDWSVCSATCSGTQTRKHSCTGVVQTQQCNLPGFVNGWYRAANCYEYLVRADSVDHPTAKTNCEGLGAKLIHVGLRSAAITADLMDKLKIFSAPAEPFHIGLEYTFATTTWTWEDTDPTPATIWAGPAPTPASDECAYMTLGNAVSGAAGACTVPRIYICERKVT